MTVKKSARVHVKPYLRESLVTRGIVERSERLPRDIEDTTTATKRLLMLSDNRTQHEALGKQLRPGFHKDIPNLSESVADTIDDLLEWGMTTRR